MCVVFVRQKTAYEMRNRDWSSDVCSSDLNGPVMMDVPMLKRDDCTVFSMRVCALVYALLLLTCAAGYCQPDSDQRVAGLPVNYKEAKVGTYTPIGRAS